MVRGLIDVYLSLSDASQVVEEEEAHRMCTELASVYGILARVYQQYAAADPDEEPYELFWDGFLKFCMVRLMRLLRNKAAQ